MFKAIYYDEGLIQNTKEQILTEFHPFLLDSEIEARSVNGTAFKTYQYLIYESIFVENMLKDLFH